jgi:hypothetical protein
MPREMPQPKNEPFGSRQGNETGGSDFEIERFDYTFD